MSEQGLPVWLCLCVLAEATDDAKKEKVQKLIVNAHPQLAEQKCCKGQAVTKSGASAARGVGMHSSILMPMHGCI